jgi:hypothetical protein
MKIAEITAFLVFGVLASFLIATREPFHVALTIFLAYCLGGLVFLMIRKVP